MTLSSLGGVSETSLPLIPHPHPWADGTVLPVSQPSLQRQLRCCSSALPTALPGGFQLLLTI